MHDNTVCNCMTHEQCVSGLVAWQSISCAKDHCCSTFTLCPQASTLLLLLLLLLRLLVHTGALLPAILQQLGLIAYSEQLTSLLEQQQQQLPQGADERAVRAAAVAAVDAVVAAAAAAGGGTGDAGFTARDLSSYLLSQVVEEGRQQMLNGAALKPHRTTGTVAY
jgi:hypothetical protein